VSQAPTPRTPFADNALAAPRAGGWERRLALLAYAAGVVVYRQAIMDDTFIHMVYARNLRAAGELAFNAGEPSLGITSPLWMLILAAVGPSAVAARLLSVACGALAVLVFGDLARRVLQRRAWTVAATVAWAGSLWLVRHAPNGMETTCGVLLVLVAVDLRARGGRTVSRDVLFGLALAGAALVRPEAFLLGVLYLVFDVPSAWGRSRIAAWLPAWILPLVAWIAFAHARTGEWLPATGAAKSAGFALAPLVGCGWRCVKRASWARRTSWSCSGSCWPAGSGCGSTAGRCSNACGARRCCRTACSRPVCWLPMRCAMSRCSHAICCS
jgi:hypothetical protein